MSTTSGAADQAVHGIDRMVRNIETGRFERTLSALTAAGALVTAGEIYFARRRQLRQQDDVVARRGGAHRDPGAGWPDSSPGARPRRCCRWRAAIVVNGLQGTYLHWRGIKQRPGGCPTSTTWSRAADVRAAVGLLVGGMGLLAALLRREHPLPGDGPPRCRSSDQAHPQRRSRASTSLDRHALGRRDRRGGAGAPRLAQDCPSSPPRSGVAATDARSAAGPGQRAAGAGAAS